jgi:tetratricopeptide (TPR) repeat protein
MYRRAYDAARRMVRHSSGDQRRQAQYLAGLSAYRLGKDRQALSMLRPVARAGAAELAGRAAATIGLIHTTRRAYDKALDYLARAEARLHGEERARVLYQSALVEQRLGQWSSAQRRLSLAMSITDDASLKRAIRQRLTAEAFTLQFGAYSKPTLAHRHADRIRGAVGRARVGSVSIVPSVTERGRRLYLVQTGRFDSQPAAAAALRRTGLDEAIVVPANKR